MVKDNDQRPSVVDDTQRKLIEDTIPTLVEEVINDESVIVEVTELE